MDRATTKDIMVLRLSMVDLHTEAEVRLTPDIQVNIPTSDQKQTTHGREPFTSVAFSAQV